MTNGNTTSNPDVINVETDTTAATQHYISSGYAEGRSTDSFDKWEYLASNPDLISRLGTTTAAAIEHYVSSGYAEGRSTDLMDCTLQAILV